MPTIPCKSAVYHPPVGAYFFDNVQYFRRFSVPHCVMKHTLALLCLLALALAGRAQHQLPNPGFELWDGGVTSEPTHWNSFATSDGTFSGFGLYTDGYYDRFLAGQSAETVCLCFRRLMREKIPCGPLDRRMGRVISD